MTARSVEAGLTQRTDCPWVRLTLVNISAGVVICPQLVSRQTAPPAARGVEANLLWAAVVDIRAALLNVLTLLAVIQPLVTIITG